MTDDDLLAFDASATLVERRDDRDLGVHDAIMSVVHADGVLVVTIELGDGRELVATCDAGAFAAPASRAAA